MGKFAHLVMVSSENNNKFYKMTEQTDGTFAVEFGRVDSTSQHTSYSMNKWDSTLKSKIKKGYKDITDLIAVEEIVETTSDGKEKKIFISDDKEVENLIKELQAFATKTIEKNYKVSSQKVTQKMIDVAQGLIDDLSVKFKNGDGFDILNKTIIEIYTTIPRKMSDVRNHLLKSDEHKAIEALINQEQQLLDTMAGQVMANVASGTTTEVINENITDEVHLLDKLGLTINKVSDKEVLSMIKTLMGESNNLMGKVFEISNNKTRPNFEKTFNDIETKDVKLFWHGSRNQNWFNIIQTGLLIRPSGAVYSGSMFGDGIYFANKARKSIGYSSLSGSYWARGGDNKSFLALFEVNIGNSKHIDKHDSSCYSFGENTIKPFNSVWAHAGSSLMNDEIIIYNPKQCTIKYLVEIKH